jgi:hypothetical protein
MFILHLPQAAKQFGAVPGEICVRTARFSCFFPVQSRFLSPERAGFRKHFVSRKIPPVEVG